MADRCRKAAGAKLELCPSMHNAVHDGFVHRQTMRDFDTDKRRERLAMEKGRKCAPLYYCPWCRASIDTRPPERITAGATDEQ